MLTDMDKEVEIKTELLEEGEANDCNNHEHSTIIFHKEIKIEVHTSEESGLGEAINTLNTYKVTEPLRKKIKYEKDLYVVPSNQTSGPVRKKGSKIKPKRKSSSVPNGSRPSTSASDLSTDRGMEASQSWRPFLEEMEKEDNESDDLDEEQEEVEAQPVDFTESGPDPLYVSPEHEQWLAQEDVASDRLVQELLTCGGAAEDLTFDWTSDHSAFSGRREVFTGTPGPTFPVNDKRPSDVFLEYFDCELLDLLARETNKYARTQMQDNLAKQSRLRTWVDTDRAEMAVFLSVLIFQGLAPLPVEQDYWRENGYLTLRYFKDLMPYNRFISIKRLLHFTDVDTQTLTEDQRELRQIWPVLDHLNEKFSSLYLPGRVVAIDESLLKWNGRLSFAQKIASKAAKVGIRSYELYESSTGYLWKFLVYTGKTRTDGQTDGQDATSDRPPPPNATARIVYDLAHPLLSLGHTIVMDNFYSSPLLARYLKSQGTDCYGTLRVNREFVPEAVKRLKKNEMRLGEIVQSFCRDLSVLMWRDNNVVALISTFHKAEVEGKQKHGRYRYKPQVVLDYNNGMGGVHRKEQLLFAHPIERVRNALCWYKKVFRRLLNVTILNAYIVFKTVHENRNMQHRTFRVQLAEELVKTFRTRPVDRPVVVKTSLSNGPGKYRRPLLIGSHYIGKAATKHGRCKLCNVRRSAYICEECNTCLCVVPCFKQFHTVNTFD